MNSSITKKLIVTFMAVIAVAGNSLPSTSPDASLASRYPMRARTPDFFARSTNNPAARYAGTVKPSNAKTPSSNSR